MLQRAQTYADLRKQIHSDLRSQHPEWIESNGQSPICDSYEARLIELLKGLSPREAQRSCDALKAYENNAM
jgi:hypothetical protein